MTLYLSMAAFSLASSISPGPVNIMALSAGMGHGFRRTLGHVIGATVGFTALLLLIGFGLHALDRVLPQVMDVLRWAGAAFLLYMAARLALDSGTVSADRAKTCPTAWTGALMQWLNPKAWMASAAGMGLFTAQGDTLQILTFALIFFVLCLISIGCWAATGAWLGQRVGSATRLRWINRTLAVLLAVSALSLFDLF